MIPSNTKKKNRCGSLTNDQVTPLLLGISILSSQAVGIVRPVASFRVNLGAVFYPGPSPVVSAKAGLPLNLSLNPGIAFARSDFSDIAPSVTSFGPIFLLLPPRLSCGHRLHGYAPQHRTAAGSGVLPPATASSIAHA